MYRKKETEISLNNVRDDQIFLCMNEKLQMNGAILLTN